MKAFWKTIKLNASYSRMANARSEQCSLIPPRQIVTRFILNLRLSLTLLADVGIVYEINSLEQWAVAESALLSQSSAACTDCHCLTFPGWAPRAGCGSAHWMPPEPGRVTSGRSSRQVAALLDSWNRKTRCLGFFPPNKAVLKAWQYFFFNIYLFICGKRSLKNNLLPDITDIEWCAYPRQGVLRGRDGSANLYRKPRDCAMSCKEKTIRNRSC